MTARTAQTRAQNLRRHLFLVHSSSGLAPESESLWVDKEAEAADAGRSCRR